MKIVYTLDPVITGQTSIFLAGGTLRNSTLDKSWRKTALDLLKQKGFDGVVYVPEWEHSKPVDWTYSRQVSWEVKALEASTVILFWIPRSEELPSFTTNIEFGEWQRSEKIVVGFPVEATRMDYIKEKCALYNIPMSNTLEATVANAIKFTKPKDQVINIFFTSDTHFNEVRTMQLSKRPFNNVDDMNWSMLKNFNKQATDKDIIFHLGDFGDPSFLKYIQAKQILFLEGNYDKPELLELIKADSRVLMLKEKEVINLNGLPYSLVHYPENMTNPDAFYLYGHIHSLQKVKRNGLNVGVDCHNYSLISLPDIEFYRNAIYNHYDNNVFC